MESQPAADCAFKHKIQINCYGIWIFNLQRTVPQSARSTSTGMDPHSAADCAFKSNIHINCYGIWIRSLQRTVPLSARGAACISGETNVNFHLFVHAHAGGGGGHSWAGTHIGKCISQSISDRKFFLFDALLKGVFDELFYPHLYYVITPPPLRWTTDKRVKLYFNSISISRC